MENPSRVSLIHTGEVFFIPIIWFPNYRCFLYFGNIDLDLASYGRRLHDAVDYRLIVDYL